MNSGFRKGIILFLGCLTLVLLTVSLHTVAITGHEGTTKVIARISPPQTSQSSELPIESSTESSTAESSQETSGSRPAGTGDAVPLLILMSAAVSLVLIVVITGVSHERKQTLE